MLSLWRDGEMGSRVVHLTDANEVGELIALFENIANEQNWRPDGALQRGMAHSIYFGLRVAGETSTRGESIVEPLTGGTPSDDTALVGGLQLALPDAVGHLSCHEVWPEIPFFASRNSQTRMAHIAMLGIVAQHRGHSLNFWRLVIEMWRTSVALGITTLLIEVTPRVLPLYRRLGWPLHLQGDLRLHWGEECYLCRLDVAEVAQTLLRRAPESPHYQQIIAQALRLTQYAQTLDAVPQNSISSAVASHRFAFPVQSDFLSPEQLAA